MPYCNVGSDSNKNTIDLYYEDFGQGDTVILIHGWPLSHRMWEKQVSALVENGFRVVAYDRRGFGDSSQPFEGYNYDVFADDLATLITHLGVDKAALVGFSMGGGEVARYIGKYGTEKVSRAVFMSSVVPALGKAVDNPDGADPAVFDGIIQGLTTNRSAFLKGFVKNFYNYEDGKFGLHEENIAYDWNIAVMASPKGTVDSVTAFGSDDFRDDIKKCDVPTLIVHGDSDAIVPFEVSGQRTHELIEGSILKVLNGAPHGITVSHAEEVNTTLIEFLRS